MSKRYIPLTEPALKGLPEILAGLEGIRAAVQEMAAVLGESAPSTESQPQILAELRLQTALLRNIIRNQQVDQQRAAAHAQRTIPDEAVPAVFKDSRAAIDRYPQYAGRPLLAALVAAKTWVADIENQLSMGLDGFPSAENVIAALLEISKPAAAVAADDINVRITTHYPVCHPPTTSVAVFRLRAGSQISERPLMTFSLPAYLSLSEQKILEDLLFSVAERIPNQ